MRPGDVVTGTQASVTITGMEWRIQLRQNGNSSILLTVLGRMPNGRKVNKQWTIEGGPAAPTDAQINAARLQVEQTAEADIVGMLS